MEFKFRKTGIGQYDFLIEKGFKFLSIKAKNDAIHFFNKAKDEPVLDPGEAFFGCAVAECGFCNIENWSFSQLESIVHNSSFNIAYDLCGDSNDELKKIILAITLKYDTLLNERTAKQKFDAAKEIISVSTRICFCDGRNSCFKSGMEAISYIEENFASLECTDEALIEIKYAFICNIKKNLAWGKYVSEESFKAALSYAESQIDYKDSNIIYDYLKEYQLSHPNI